MKTTELQKCVSCGEDYPIDSYPVAGMKKGKLYRRRKCQRCYAGVKKSRKRLIRKWIDDYKKKCQCLHCKTKDFRVLEFHHVGDDKDFHIGNAVRQGFSIEKIEKELAKCICLCANCHRIEHYNSDRDICG